MADFSHRKEGIIYYLPRSDYVGKTVRSDSDERMLEHQRNGKNVDGWIVLESTSELDPNEAYYIGFKNTYRPAAPSYCQHGGSLGNGDRGLECYRSRYMEGLRDGGHDDPENPAVRLAQPVSCQAGQNQTVGQQAEQKPKLPVVMCVGIVVIVGLIFFIILFLATGAQTY
jgi:hypothetical protein